MNVADAKTRAVAIHSRQAQHFARRYAELSTHPYGSCFSYSRRRLEAALTRVMPPPDNGRRVLDVGCGTGHHLSLFRQRGYDVVGTDGSEEMVALARASNPGVTIAQGDVEKLSFGPGEFDVVLCIEVLRYLPRLTACLREMARVLRPDGVCLATAISPWNLNGYWIVNRLASTGLLPGFTALKQSFHTARYLRRQFAAAGFEPVRIHGVYCGPMNWIERLAPKALSWTLRRWEPVDSRVADRPVIRGLSNMFLIHAVRGHGSD